MAKPIFIMRLSGNSYHRYSQGDELTKLLRDMAVELHDYHFIYLYDGLLEGDTYVFECHNVDTVPESDINDLKERLEAIAKHGMERIEAEREQEKIKLADAYSMGGSGGSGITHSGLYTSSHTLVQGMYPVNSLYASAQITTPKPKKKAWWQL